MPVAPAATRRFASAIAFLSLAAAGCSRGGSAAGPSPADGPLPLKYVGPPTRPAITAGDLMTRLYAYADDSMMGRDAGSEFNIRATDYLEREVRRLGLEPGGEDGTFFQHPVVYVATDPSLSTLSVNGTPYTLWRDFAPRNQGEGARPFDGVPVVYGGSFADTARMIAPSAAAGRTVLVTLANDSTGRPDWNSVNRPWLLARYPAAAAVVVVFIDHAPRGYIDAVFARRQLAVRGSGGRDAGPSYFYVTEAVGRAMMGGDPSTMAPGARGGTARGAMRFSETAAPGRNVVAILRGADPVLRNEFVVIGAHNDHVGFNTRPVDHDSVRLYNLMARPQGAESRPRPLNADEARRLRTTLDSLRARHGGPRPDSIYNGADDDGSGSVSLLEIAESYATARARPRRSIVFVWHVGEEYGMFGSRYFTDHPPVAREAIVADLNIDMIGRGGAADVTGVTSAGVPIEGGPGYVQLIGSRRLSTELGDLVERVNTEGRFGLRFDYALDADGHPQNIYCRSDHAMYARWGIPVVFFTTGGHADYHQVTDEPQYIDYDRMETVARFVRALADRVAGLDHRPVVNGPRPDPDGPCRQ